VRRLPTILAAALLAMLALALPAGAANPWLERRVLNIAHQGGEDQFPSNTMYAYKKALRAGADMLELDIGVTRDNKVIVMHDTSVDRITNGHGLVSRKTLEQIRRLDAAFWFAPRAAEHYSHKLKPSAYRFRGVATGKRPPPRGFSAADFRVPTLRQVLRAFPRTPINIEIKGRTKQERTGEYVYNAEVLARALRGVRRNDLIVASFKDAAVARFHELAPRFGLNAAQDATTAWFLGGELPPGTVAFQVPITYELGGAVIQVTTPETVARAHREGYAWHNWFSGMDVDGPATWRRLIDYCVDGIMTSRPVRLERTLRSHPAPARCAQR
jgi:glycerophosphoryl diester phosphodiesterase